jgi:hypothetical protein
VPAAATVALLGLFAVLSIKNKEAAAVFATMVEHTKQAGPPLPATQLAAIQTAIVEAFRAGFLLMALFTTAGFFLALTNPLRRI